MNNEQKKYTNLFNPRILKKYLANYNPENEQHFIDSYKYAQKWKKSIDNSSLEKTKEKSMQGNFFGIFFKGILGYPTVDNGESEWMLEQETTSKLDGSSADGTLGFFKNENGKIVKNVRVVIELKDATTDLDKKQHRENHLTPIEQGFSYAYKNGSSCKWVIVSNFKEIRLYRSNSALEYEVFFITDFDDMKEFKRFYFLLRQEHLIKDKALSLIDILLNETEQSDHEMTDKFYKDYSELRDKLFSSIKENNIIYDSLTLFAKTQKIMDRFLFICFAEDKGLLPSNLFADVLNISSHSFSLEYNQIWSQLKGLFKSIDKGNTRLNINGYNGGLFKEDTILEQLIIPDDVLSEFRLLSEVDFDSDINVNILGHIFEHSLVDIERIKNEINGIKEPDKKKSKRKSDGIFYTPEYVTDYIVDNTIGRWMDDKKEQIKSDLLKGGYKVKLERREVGKEKDLLVRKITNWLEIPDIGESDKYQREAITKLHISFYERYSQSLKDLRIIDPACGSGAFLNSALKYLEKEIIYITDMLDSLRGGALSFIDINKQILENNLYGVDINEESVEITKLSLWLQTAKKGQKLTSLDHAIKCGNSLISDENIAGELAFNWEKEFSDIMAGGGFDICIGNPPYGAVLSNNEKDYLAETYETTEGRYDTYKTFFELGFKLLKSNGFIGYITPNTFLVLEKGALKLRKLLYVENKLLNLVEIFNVFSDAVVEPVISIYQKCLPASSFDTFEVISIPRRITPTSTFINEGIRNPKEYKKITQNNKLIFNYRAKDMEDLLASKIHENTKPLNTYFDVFQGAIPYGKGEGKPPQTKEDLDNKPYTGYDKLSEDWVPYIRGKHMNRYVDCWNGEYIKYGPWLCRPRKRDLFVNDKVLIRQTSDYPVATLDLSGKVCNDTLHCICYKEEKFVDLKYCLGLINSKLIKWIFQFDNFTIVGQPLAQTKAEFVKNIPIMLNKNKEDMIIENVNILLDKNKVLHEESHAFIENLKSIYNLIKPSEKLLKFYYLNESEFLEELKKSKADNLTTKDKMELLPLLREKKTSLLTLSNNIQTYEDKIDEIVFEIYNLTNMEIKLVSG